jgi:hypothetical protein
VGVVEPQTRGIAYVPVPLFSVYFDNAEKEITEYVQIKPLLVLATVILKATDTYREGALRWDAGYTYVSVVYNASICLSL